MNRSEKKRNTKRDFKRTDRNENNRKRSGAGFEYSGANNGGSNVANVHNGCNRS
jgi:hypothetical protein